MLVLERKEGESITLTLEDGRTILIRLMQSEKGRSRFGILAGRSIAIERTHNRNGQIVAKKGK